MKKKTIVGAFLFFNIILWTFAPGHAPTQTASKSEVSKQTIDTQTKNDIQDPAPKIKAMDKAG
ncbi:MAG: hypothetical protein PVF36_02630, partial [Desulfobacterales bacterium]